MNKKELAEQIAELIANELGGYKTVYMGNAYEVVRSQFVYKSDVLKIAADIAAIIEAMGEKPESNLCLKQATDSVDTIDALVLDYITYLELDALGKLNEAGSFINDESVSHVFACLRKAKELINERQFFLLKDILTKRVKPISAEAMGKPEDEADHNPNVHNLDITYTGVCRKCGGTNLMDAPSPTQVEAMGVQPGMVTIGLQQTTQPLPKLLELDGVIIKHRPAPEVYGGVGVHTLLGDYAIAKADQKRASKLIGHKVRVKEVPECYKTVEILWKESKPALNTEIPEPPEAIEPKAEAMGVQPGMRWVKASKAPYDTWVLLGNEHFIGVAKRKQKKDRGYGEPEWHDETNEYIDTKGKRFYYMPLPPKPNNEQNVQVSDTTDDAQSNVADNQEAIEPKGESFHCSRCNGIDGHRRTCPEFIR